MFKTSYMNKNIILSVILILVFILSTGAIIPVNMGTNTAKSAVISSGPAITRPENGKQPKVNQNPTSGNSYYTAETAKSNSQNAVQSVSSVNSLPSPLSYNTTTIYDNGANFNQATGALLPFAERYRINSTLNGWVYNNNGMNPNYVPMNKFVYQYQNLPGNSFLDTNTNSSLVPNFPSLQFIPGFSVSIVLNVTKTNINTGLLVYNSTDYLVGYATNSTYINNVTIIPTSQNPYYIKVVNSASTTENFTLTIQETVNPNFVDLFMGDQGTNVSSFNWFFNSSLTSFGVLAPNTLDLNTLIYNRSDTASTDYFNNGYTNYGYSSVIDNFTYWSTQVPSLFNITSTSSCNDGLSTVARCQSFLPMFFYTSTNATSLSNGMWIPSLEPNHVFGANPQVMRFLGYFGQYAPMSVNKILVTDSTGKTVLDLSQSFLAQNITTPNIASFVEQLTVSLPTTSLTNGSYTLKIYQGSTVLYSYPFKVLDSLYGNYYSPVVNFGYENVTFPSLLNTESSGTVVYANATDLDTSIANIQLSYTTDGLTWTTGNMTWLDANHWGFVIPYSLNNIVNVSLSVYESAPSDQGKLRLQTITQFLPDVIDLNYNTSTIMQVTLIPRGLSTTSQTQISFLNDNSYTLTGLGGVTLVSQNGYFIYTNTSNLAVNSETKFNVTITPRNSGLLTITKTSTSGTDSETSNVFLNVLGLPTATAQISIIPDTNGNLKSLYPYLNTTYPITVQYSFIGGAPHSNFNIVVSGGNNSLSQTILTVNASDTYPLTNYQKTLNAPVVASYSSTSAKIYANITYDSIISPTATNQITVYPPSVAINLYDLNGNPLSLIYNKIVNQLSIRVQLIFSYGIPKNNPYSLTISPFLGYFTQKTISLNNTQIVNNQINITVNLDHNANYNQPTENFISTLNWDNKVNSSNYLVNIDSNLIYYNILALKLLTTQKLNSNSTTNTVEMQLQSYMNINLANVQMNLQSSDGFGINPNKITIPFIPKNGVANITFKLTTPQNFVFSKDSFSINATTTIPGYQLYTSSVTVTFNIPASSLSNSSSSGKQTPGFEIVPVLVLFALISIFTKKRKFK